MCGCGVSLFLVVYAFASLFVGMWHLQQWVDYGKPMLTIKQVDSIGMILYYLLSIPAKIIGPLIYNTYKLIKTVLTCKFK